MAVAVSQRRRAEWERVFGTARVPVLDGRPRYAELNEGPVLVYDVALAALHPGQLARLAGYVARCRRMGYEEAKALVELGVVLIRADDVVIETADADRSVGRLRFRRGEYATPSWTRVSRAGLS